MACDAVRLDGVFTADLHRYNPLFGIEKATHLKSNFFLEEGMCQDKKLASKAVAEAVRFLPESTLPLYLRSLRLEERYTEAARACTSLEELSASSSLRLHLKQGVRPAYCWLAAERDRLRRTVATKDRGDACFKTGDYRIAAMNYTQCLTVDSEIGSQPHKETAGGRLHAVLFCNRAACYMALKKFRDAYADCSSALEIQPNYLKAILRRGRCFARLERYQESLTDFSRWMTSVKKAKANPSRYAGIFETASDISSEEIERVSKEIEEIKRSMGEFAEPGWVGGEARENHFCQSAKTNFFNGRNGSDPFAGIPRKSSSRRNRATKNDTAKCTGTNNVEDSVPNEPRRGNNNAGSPPTSELACHYDVLQVSKNSSIAEIKRAFRKLALKYHPDKNADPLAAAVFRRISAAYEVLGDISSKRKYDILKIKENVGKY